MASEDDRIFADAMRNPMLWVIVGLLIILTVLGLALEAASARDRGQFGQASPEIKAWFNGLASAKGPCCSYADGASVDDPDWETKSGHYRVRIHDLGTPGDPMVWVDVPDEAVITEPNRIGRTMVWPFWSSGGPKIRCFMPGSMT